MAFKLRNLLVKLESLNSYINRVTQYEAIEIAKRSVIAADQTLLANREVRHVI